VKRQVSSESCETNPIPPGPGRAASRQAKDAKRTQFRESISGGQGRWCETNPISGGRDTPAIPVRGNMQTKPNLGRIGCLGKFQCHMMALSPKSGTCETNPICPGRAGRAMAGVNRAKRTQFPPMPGGTGPQGRGTRGKCAKRSQFGGPIVQNEPNLARRRVDAARGVDTGQICKRPNFRDLRTRPPARGRDKPAKRTTPAGRATRPPGAGAGRKCETKQSVLGRCQVTPTKEPRAPQTNLISTAYVGRGQVSDTGQTCKRSQFPATWAGRDLRPNSLPTRLQEGLWGMDPLCKTKPISARQAHARKLESAPGCRTPTSSDNR
jgi:hypothetical protein